MAKRKGGRKKPRENSFPELDRINEISNSKFIDLTKWLYDNHREILREWEKTQGNVRVEFL